MKCFFLFLLLSFSLLTFNLHAGGFGKADDGVIFEGDRWFGVFFDMNGISFTASMPNYSGASIGNGWAVMTGQTNDNAAYLIETTLNPGFTPPKTLIEFVRLIQDANPDYIVIPIDPGHLGAKYVVDMIPNSPVAKAYWRYLSTKNRIVKMGTNDTKYSRCLLFFESIHIN
jgi:hypothetical protein